MSSLNILIAGVGGQGTLLASRVLGNVALKKSYDVKLSEVHGMSQRGGSVVTHVKFGKKVYSPLIEKGYADIVIAFEQLEALRWFDYLKPDGKLIINDQVIDPMPVIIGKAKYPEGIVEKIKKNHKSTISLDALSLAKQSGNIKAVNVVLLGLLASETEISKDIWIESLIEVVPGRFIDVNMKAFELGYSLLDS